MGIVVSLGVTISLAHLIYYKRKARQINKKLDELNVINRKYGK